ncbi:hypothetical protein EYZ11_011645 [Aspergillus tanneri]|uniref:Uncharacterized protein n=1 Tax=Aspergillus tanneri TaxID=1220188 RepID=A0A4S3J7L2_9EURO|nr:hypothetical protein EYZ11_011645 [Aspergillus tanneri]
MAQYMNSSGSAPIGNGFSKSGFDTQLLAAPANESPFLTTVTLGSDGYGAKLSPELRRKNSVGKLAALV